MYATSFTTYRKDIDGLRAVAVLAVLLHHVAPRLLPGGYVGVDVFFVISGYLITQIIRTECAQNVFSFSNFYERRARRLFPALFAMMTATLLIAHWLFLPSDLTATLRASVGTATFSSNVIFWRDLSAGYFAATDVTLNPLLHTWSLGVEEQFYLLFPVFILLLRRYLAQYTVHALLAAASLSLILASCLVGERSVAVFFLSPFRAWELLVGSLLAFDVVPRLHKRWIREAMAASGTAAILIACFLFDTRTLFPGLSALLPVLGAATVLHSGATGTTAVSAALSLRPAMYLGRISYSLYLWHWPVITFTKYWYGREDVVASPTAIALMVAVSIGLAALSYRYIEQPFRSGQQLLSRGGIARSSVVVSIVVCAIAGTGLFFDAYRQQVDASVVHLDAARSPTIPFVECDDRPIRTACRIGNKNVDPELLLWGDSHMLAWAPVLDKVMLETQRSAILFPVSSCPPLMDPYGVTAEIRCAASAKELKQFLEQTPKVQTIVLAAYWSSYFGDRTRDTTQAAYASTAFTNTLSWLHAHHRKVVLVGPVPTFGQSVPLSLALDRKLGRHSLITDIQTENAKNRGFLHAIREVEPNVVVASPIDWLCRPECLRFADGFALYRDAHHLSVQGAMFLEQQMRETLSPSLSLGHPG